MEQTVLIPIKDIVDNPYQHREQEDPAAVEELAISIARNGLQQFPAVRAVNSHYELVFGHTRRAAYRLLATQGVPTADIKADKQYAQIPVYVRDLTDRQMFELAIVENLKRRDPKPTEKAKAIQKYMDEFKATSKEAGELFGMNDATARGMVRLLDLVPEAQSALDEGRITQGTARTLLSMQKIASSKVIAETIKQIEEGKDNRVPDDIIDDEIMQLDDVVELWNGNHRDGKPRAGRYGWLLDMKNFPNKLLEHLAPGDYVKLGLVKKDQLTKAHTDYSLGDKDADLSADLKAKIDHLSNPPTCTACPFYTKIRDSHYCGMKICRDRKLQAWDAYLIEQASKQLKIDVYAETDGPFKVLDSDHQPIFEKRNSNLRLISKKKLNGYFYQWGFKGIEDDVMLVVGVGDLLPKLRKAKTANGRVEVDRSEQKLLRMYREKRRELIWEFTAVAKTMFDAVPHAVLLKLNGWKYITQDNQPPTDEIVPDNAKVDAAKTDYQRRLIVWRMCGIDDFQESSTRTALIKVATRLEKLAKEWGVKFPKSLVKLAEQFDAEIKAVAVETKKGKE